MIPTGIELTPEQLVELIAFLASEGHWSAAVDVAADAVANAIPGGPR